jgi:hypothetical protein
VALDVDAAADAVAGGPALAAALREALQVRPPPPGTHSFIHTTTQKRTHTCTHTHHDTTHIQRERESERE